MRRPFRARPPSSIILGEKGARSEIDRVFALAADPEPATRAAALGALSKLAGEADLPRLVAMLETATDGDDIVRTFRTRSPPRPGRTPIRRSAASPSSGS